MGFEVIDFRKAASGYLGAMRPFTMKLEFRGRFFVLRLTARPPTPSSCAMVDLGELIDDYILLITNFDFDNH